MATGVTCPPWVDRLHRWFTVRSHVSIMLSQSSPTSVQPPETLMKLDILDIFDFESRTFVILWHFGGIIFLLKLLDHHIEKIRKLIYFHAYNKIIFCFRYFFDTMFDDTQIFKHWSVHLMSMYKTYLSSFFTSRFFQCIYSHIDERTWERSILGYFYLW